MHISATARGGFTGIGEHYEIDTATNPHGKALEAVVQRSGFFTAAAPDGSDAGGGDQLNWTIAIADGSRRRSISLVESGLPGQRRWQALLDAIRAAGQALPSAKTAG